VSASGSSLLMQLSTPVCVLRGPRHVVELANPPCCEVWGCRPEDAVGRSLMDVRPDEVVRPYKELLDGVLRTGERATGEARVVMGPEGRRRTAYFSFLYSPLRDERGAVDGVLVVAFDVTDEVRAREALAQTVRYNEMFAGILAHDLRSPLGAISTAAQLVQMRRPDDERIASPVSRILTSSARMARMIDQLLDFTRIRLGGGLRLERNRVDLVEVLRAAVSETESASPGWRARVETLGDGWGSWDADRMAQALSNLAGNAAQHGAPDAPATVRLDGREAGRVTLTFENRGAIPRALLPNLFDPFHAAQRLRSNGKGLGLGLFIAREIVSAHGGGVDVTSGEVTGTRFTVVLPRGHAPA
jgi:PAS domain S-box-containing protein